MPTRHDWFVRLAVIWTVVIVAITTYLATADRTSTSSQIVGNAGILLALVFSTVLCVLAARRPTPARRGWAWMAAGSGLTALNVVLYSVEIFGGATRGPSPVLDAIGIIGYAVPLIAAMFLLAQRPAMRISRTRMMLDALVITVGVVVIGQATVLHDLYLSADLSTLAGWVQLTYPVADLAICSLVLTLGMWQDPARRLVWLCFGSGQVILAVTDSTYVSLTSQGRLSFAELTGSPLALGWVLAPVLIGLSTLVATDRPPSRPRTLAILTQLVPYIPVLGAYGILFVKFALDDIPLLAGEVLLLVLVMVRQAMIVVENVNLTSGLERKVADRTTELASVVSIVTSSGDAIVGLSNDNIITTWNPAAERLFGYRAEEVLGRPPTFLPPVAFAETAQLVSSASGAGPSKLAEYEVDWPRPDGTTTPVAITVSPIVDGERIQGISILGQDITERRLVEATLEAARAEAMESSRLKSDFLATMSHEIRTPMNGVIGLTSLLLVTDLDDQQRQYAEGVQTAGEALLALINDILDFSKLEAGKVLLDPADFDVRKMVDELGALLAPAAFDKRLELIAFCQPEVPEAVHGDGGRIRQILLNLASNAVKFTPQGEVAVTVGSQTTEDGQVQLRFTVRDTGIGISAHDQQRLFQSFSQADTSTTRRFGGTGLGLAISRRLVEAMAGEIGLDSAPGAGSTFWFEVTLPLATAPIGSAEPPDPDLLTEKRVLVVDDNATNRMILAAQLGSWDMQADLVEGAQAALRLLRSMAARGTRYDVAVLDMVMPDIDGLQLARIISADPTLTGLPLIMLTSSLPPDPAELREAGIRQWLSKPMRSSDLYDRVVRLLTTRELRVDRPPPVRPAEPTEARGCILVVEDNTLNQLVAEGVVSKMGYQVHTVANGLEALEALAAQRYSAVLMDCHMPVMDGLAATAEIRRRELDGPRTPIIAMTAAALIDDRRLCLEAGMDDYVSKPIDAGTLKAVLARWVSARSEPAGADSAAPSRPTAGYEAKSVLDQSRLADLSELQTPDGSSLLSSIVHAFIGRSNDRLADLRKAVDGGHLADLQAAAHEMKGASGTIGAGRVAALCRELELSTKPDAPALRAGLLDDLEGELAAATAELTQYMAAHS